MNHVAFKGASQARSMKDRNLPFQDEKSRQALEDFKKFCNFILAYEATEEAKRGSNSKRDKRPNSPSGSSGSSVSTTDSLNEDVKIPVKRKYSKHKNAQNEEYDSDDESMSLVTCFCRKPFAGRPMIECSSCNIWIHLSCAKIRRSNIPDLFICPTCRDKHSNQIKTLVNELEDNKNSFTSIKKHKSKTKRQSLDGRKSTLTISKEERMDEK